MTPPRFLVVDDHQALRELVTTVLRARGEVDAVATASEALALLPDHAYAAVVCDLHLGDESGLDVLAWIAKHRPELERRFILIGGDISSTEGPGFRCLAKPFKMGDLLELVDQVLAA